MEIPPDELEADEGEDREPRWVVIIEDAKDHSINLTVGDAKDEKDLRKKVASQWLKDYNRVPTKMTVIKFPEEVKKFSFSVLFE